MFLAKTIENILENIEADTEVIAVLDGEWANPKVPHHERVNKIYVPEAIGQRAAQNIAVRLSDAKFVMKVDAHCSFDAGFDRKMIEGFEKMGYNTVMVPVMRNLWAFDWKCLLCGKRWYQGPTPTKCEETSYRKSGQPCKGKKFERKMMWVGKTNPQSTSYAFDSQPHFQYFNEYKERPEYKKMKEETGFTETMSLQGSCFMSTREKYWELELSDESLGNWGNQGIELACAAWLSGARVLVNHNTWYAHMFRTKGGDFGFPWPASGRATQQTKDLVWSKFKNKKHPKQIYPVSWLVEKFWPITPGTPDAKNPNMGWTETSLRQLKQEEAK